MKKSLFKTSLLSLVFFVQTALMSSHAVALSSVSFAFKDVPVTHSNYKAIEYLKNKGIITGYPDGTFRPDQTVERAEALKIINNASEIMDVNNDSFEIQQTQQANVELILQSAEALDSGRIKIVFSKPVFLRRNSLENFVVNESENVSKILDIMKVDLSIDRMSVILTTVPQKNIKYNVVVLDVTDQNGKTIAIDNNSAVFVGKTITFKNFKDTSTNQWYWIYVANSVNKGIVSGYSDGTFRPAQTVNLVENLKMLLLAKGVNTQSMMLTQNPYTDAYKTEWYAKYVQYAKDKNLIDADSLNKIYPAQGLTRGKLAEMVYRLLYIQENNLSSYTKEKVFSGFVEVSIQDFTFPDQIIITKGTKVRWTNKDTSSHSVVSNDKKFDSGKLTQGKSFELTFTQVGTYDYHCAIHPLMKGKVVVQ